MKFNKLKKPYIIAEIGINHDGKFLKAKKLVFEAKKAGADAVKFQVFKPATLEGEKLKKTKFQNKTSEKKSLTNIWRKVSLNYNSLKKLRNYSAKISIDFICTPFDFESLKLIKKLNLKAIKVASSDVTDIPLLLEISKLKKPVIMSTGMSNSKEIDHAIKVIEIFEEAKKQGRGSTSLDGLVIDVPVVKRAESLLKISKDMGKI